MRKVINTALIAIVLVSAAFGFRAADLKNEDGKRYEVKVHDGGTTRNTWIDGGSTILSICSGCEIEVVGVGKIKVSGSDTVTIKDGKLIKK